MNGVIIKDGSLMLQEVSKIYSSNLPHWQEILPSTPPLEKYAHLPSSLYGLMNSWHKFTIPLMNIPIHFWSTVLDEWVYVLYSTNIVSFALTDYRSHMITIVAQQL